LNKSDEKAPAGGRQRNRPDFLPAKMIGERFGLAETSRLTAKHPARKERAFPAE